MAIFNISPDIPNRNRPPNKANALVLNPIKGITTTYMQTAIKHIILELYLAINQPARGNETSDPIGNPIKTVPNVASDKCNNCLKSGMRVAQVAKFKPHKRNKIPIPIRDLWILIRLICSLRQAKNSRVQILLSVNYVAQKIGVEFL